MWDDVIFDRSSMHVAFTHDRAVFSYENRYLGTIEGRYFWDRRGHAVAFMEGASNGPSYSVPPIPSIPPYHPFRQYLQSPQFMP
jgi:hypothetical protein